MGKLSRVVAIVVVVATLSIGAGLGGNDSAAAYSGPANLNACNPNPVPAYYQGEIDNLINGTYSTCAAVPYNSYAQRSGWIRVGGGWAWFYMQQNPDGYTQLQLSGPGQWWAYWQQNPRDGSRDGCAWYQEQVNTSRGGPSYFTTGWWCG